MRQKYGRLFILPWFIGILIFYIFPIIQSIYYAFAEVTVIPGGTEIIPVGLKNFKYILFEDPNYTTWLKSQLVETLYSLPLILLLSLVLAIVLNQKFKGRLFFRALYFLPVIIATGPVISWLFSTGGSDLTQMGLSDSFTASMLSIDDIVKLLQIDGKIANYITITISKIFDLIWSCGIQIILFLSGLQSIPRTLYEASRVEGATKWEEFWFITFPMLSRVTLLVGIFTMVELMVNSRGMVIKKAFSMMSSGIYDKTSAMLWFYFLIFGTGMGIIVLIYNKVLMRRWND